jgi:hypothetical protein
MSGGDDGLSTHLLDEHFLLDTLMMKRSRLFQAFSIACQLEISPKADGQVVEGHSAVWVT